jgi:ABC-type nitrate/sulfonate/bicarbonate transport system substrate-binding protein
MWNVSTIARPSRRSVVGGMGAVLAAPAVCAQTPLRDLTIPISSTSFATASLRAAIDLGCFRANGLNVSAPVMESGSNVMTALISGSVQIILGGPGEHIAAQARGVPVVLLTNCYWGQSGSLIVARDVIEKSGVPRSAPLRDRLRILDGLTVASVSATSSFTVTYRGTADGAGVKLNFVYMSQPAMGAALETGAIKAYIASAPMWGGTVAKGLGTDWISAPRGEVPDANVPRGATGLHAMRPFAEANPALMRQVLASYRAFSDILERSPAEVRASLGRLYPSVEPASMDILFAAENRAWRMRDVTVDDMKHEIAFVKASGAPIPNLDAIDAAGTFYVPPRV